MGKLAKQFMHKCAEYSDYIAFILPASFAKVTQIRQLPEYFHLIHQEDLLDETFRFERDGKKVSTVFQIWERRDQKRVDPPKTTFCKDFSFTNIGEVTFGQVAEKIIQKGVNRELKKDIEAILKEYLSQKSTTAPDDADIAICTHGSGAGKVYSSGFERKNSRTHRFIKNSSGLDNKDLAKRLRTLDYESIFKYTVGATCVSTEEIVYLYTQKYLEE